MSAEEAPRDRTLSVKAAFLSGAIGAALLLGASYGMDRNGHYSVSGTIMGAFVAPFRDLTGMALVILAGFAVIYITRDAATRRSTIAKTIRHPIRAFHERYQTKEQKRRQATTAHQEDHQPARALSAAEREQLEFKEHRRQYLQSIGMDGEDE